MFFWQASQLPQVCSWYEAGDGLELGCSPRQTKAPHVSGYRSAVVELSVVQPPTRASDLGANSRERGEVLQPLRAAGDCSGSCPAPSGSAATIAVLPGGTCDLLSPCAARPRGHRSGPGDPPGHCNVLVPITVTHRSAWGGLSSGRHRRLIRGAPRPHSSFSSRLLNLIRRKDACTISSVLTQQFFQQVPSKWL